MIQFTIKVIWCVNLLNKKIQYDNLQKSDPAQYFAKKSTGTGRGPIDMKILRYKEMRGVWICALCNAHRLGGLCESLDGSSGWEGGKAAGEQLVGVGTSPAAAGQLDQAAAWQEVSRSIPAWCWWVRQSELRWVIGCGAFDRFASSILSLLKLIHGEVGTWASCWSRVADCSKCSTF